VFEQTRDEQGRLFVYAKKDAYVAYPFLVRRIGKLPFGARLNGIKEELFDIVSPWYFGGPLSRITGDSAGLELYAQFLDEFHAYCVDNRIVTEFGRLHPLFSSHLTYAKVAPGVKRDRVIVYVDLEQDEQTIWRNLKESNRRAIVRARRRGISIEVLTADEGFERFQPLYRRTMKRKGAGEEYLFPEAFFEKMKDLLPESIVILCARLRGDTLGSAVFLHKYEFVNYYLGGSDERFLRLCPNNLMFYEAILWAKESGYKYFVLGGGYRPEDSLLSFKLSFSRATADFYVYKKVHSAQAYERLCQSRDAYDNSLGVSGPKTGYFPEYRRPWTN
jgi:hypothetical protein